MTTKILLVEDDQTVSELLQCVLETQGWTVSACASGSEAVGVFDQETFDLIILDLMMADFDGFDFCRATKERRLRDKIPLLILTAKQDAKDRYAAFELGANDYLTKPFDPRELLLRIQAFLRLTAPEQPAAQDVIEVGAVRLMPQAYKAFVTGREVQLTKMETLLLRYLMMHEGHVFSADTLASNVFEHLKARGCTDDAIHAHIRNIRTKLEVDPRHPTLVVTVGKKGYAFASDLVG